MLPLTTACETLEEMAIMLAEPIRVAAQKEKYDPYLSINISYYSTRLVRPFAGAYRDNATAGEREIR